MFKRLRIAFLLYLLLGITAAQYLSHRHLAAWDSTIWVDVYPLDGDHTAATGAFLDRYAGPDLDALQAFVGTEAARYGVGPTPPIAFELAPRLDQTLPPPPESVLGAIVWSLRMRWLLARLHWASERPTPDLTVFAVYHDGRAEPTLERSVGARKGGFAVAHLFAVSDMRGSNEVILLHEIMHTLGATDKYDPATDLPVFPIGYADPGADPRFPQHRAEIMGGRIPISPTRATIPSKLSEVTIADATALEIGWLKPR